MNTKFGNLNLGKPKFNVDDKVIITSDQCQILVARNSFINKEGKIKEIVLVFECDKVSYGYYIEFFDKDTQKRNVALGRLIWYDNEISLEDKFVPPPTKVIELEDAKIIVKYPEIIYILYHEGRMFKSKTTLLEGDTWNEERGVEVAKAKAERKRDNFIIKQVKKEKAKSMRKYDLYIEKLEKNIEEYDKFIKSV